MAFCFICSHFFLLFFSAISLNQLDLLQASHWVLKMKVVAVDWKCRRKCTQIGHLNAVFCLIYDCFEFQVTGCESLKRERPSRPVKIAESDADVSESQCSQNKYLVYPPHSFL